MHLYPAGKAPYRYNAQACDATDVTHSFTARTKTFFIIVIPVRRYIFVLRLKDCVHLFIGAISINYTIQQMLCKFELKI